jgi:LysM repeat protein
MRRLRWLVLEFGIALLLLAALQGALWSSTQAAASGQPAPPTGTRSNSPHSTFRWAMQPMAMQTITEPAAGAPAEPSVTPAQESSDAVTTTGALTATGTPTYYVVLRGDTLSAIAGDFDTTVEAIMAANRLSNPDILRVGQVLAIPGPEGELPDASMLPVARADGDRSQPIIVPRGTITERMTLLAQQADATSPYYETTWLTYYGRPNVPVMGILGEFPIEELVPILREKAEVYSRANGDSLKVMPAFHLVYGMATKAPGADGSHLGYIEESEVLAYIEAAEAEGWAVILDVQIGALSPTEAIIPALRYLKYPNVHLAIDPEFAMVYPNQRWPGNPIGYVTGDQVNLVQGVINTYLAARRLPGPRILLVHQFQSSMIVEPEKMDMNGYSGVALTLSVDGWGPPWGKISKYNSFVTPDSPYAAFKLFYRWDEPLLTPDEALGNEPHRGTDFYMDITPNLIIYQ